MIYKAVLAVSIACGIASIAIAFYYAFEPLAMSIWGLFQ